MITQQEIAQAKLYATGEWALLSYDSMSTVSTWVRRDGTKLHFRETMSPDVVQDIADLNAEKSKAWRGFHQTPHGAVVASIPIPIYNQMRDQCGWDGVEYDQTKFNRMLNDSDNRAWRTGGGKLKTDNKKMV
jgi:hypothetical protein